MVLTKYKIWLKIYPIVITILCFVADFDFCDQCTNNKITFF